MIFKHIGKTPPFMSAKDMEELTRFADLVGEYTERGLDLVEASAKASAELDKSGTKTPPEPQKP